MLTMQVYQMQAQMKHGMVLNLLVRQLIHKRDTRLLAFKTCNYRLNKAV